MQVNNFGYIIKRWVRLEPFLKTAQKLGPLYLLLSMLGQSYSAISNDSAKVWASVFILVP